MPRLQPLPPAGPPALPAPSTAESLGELLEPIRAENGMPALGAAVVHHGAVVGIGAVGLDRVDADTPADVDDFWHIGSDGKAMTATLMARLVERGDLSWDSTVGDVLADLEPHEDWSGVTLEQLLTHTSGMPSNPHKLWMLRLIATEDPAPVARRRVLADILSEPPEHTPGSKYLYSNLGYTTAGAMAESVTSASYADLERDQVWAPLGVVDHGFGPPPPPSPVGHAGDQHSPIEPVPVADNPPAIAPAGTMHFTLTSWAAFVSAHVDGDRGGRLEYLSAESWAFLHRARLENYAAG
jgi:D-alanyl-D-alanine carboxypeptidase